MLGDFMSAIPRRYLPNGGDGGGWGRGDHGTGDNVLKVGKIGSEWIRLRGRLPCSAWALQVKDILDGGEVDGVSRVDDRHHGRGQLARIESGPVEAVEESLRDGVAARLAEVIRESVVRLEHALINVDRLVVAKGRKPREHLEQEHAERPVVNLAAVAVAREHLGRRVLGRAADGPRALSPVLHAHAGAKVDQDEVAGRVDQRVLRLDVAVHPRVRVHVRDRGDGDGGVEGGGGRVEPVGLAQKVKQLESEHRL
eukprot:4158863-Pleurochrysis_carterae.AAC.3